jgi:hypothetical protein
MLSERPSIHTAGTSERVFWLTTSHFSIYLRFWRRVVHVFRHCMFTKAGMLKDFRGISQDAGAELWTGIQPGFSMLESMLHASLSEGRCRTRYPLGASDFNSLRPQEMHNYLLVTLARQMIHDSTPRCAAYLMTLPRFNAPVVSLQKDAWSVQSRPP